MPRSKDTFSPQTNLPISFKPRLEALAAHREQSVSAAVGDAVRDAILKFEAGDTKDAKLDRILEQLEELNKRVALLEAVGFASLNALDVTVHVADSDWARVEQLIANKK